MGWVAAHKKSYVIPANTFKDLDGEILSLSATLSSGLPVSPLVFNPSTGEISGILATAGIYSFRIKATDSNGQFVTNDFSVTVVANQPPVSPGLVDQLFIVDTGGTYAIPKWVDPESDALTYTETKVSVCATQGTTFTFTTPSGNNAALLSVPIGVLAGTYECTIESTDSFVGGTASESFEVIINTRPSISAFTDQTVIAGQLFQYDISSKIADPDTLKAKVHRSNLIYKTNVSGE